MDFFTYVQKEDIYSWNACKRGYHYTYLISTLSDDNEENWINITFRRVMCHSYNEEGIYGVFPHYYISIRDKNFTESLNTKDYKEARILLKEVIDECIYDMTVANSEEFVSEEEEDE